MVDIFNVPRLSLIQLSYSANMNPVQVHGQAQIIGETVGNNNNSRMSLCMCNLVCTNMAN